MARQKPTVQDILDAENKLWNDSDALRSAFKEDEKFYDLEIKDMLDIPDEYLKEGFVLPTGRDMIDTFVDHIDISNARVFVNRKGTTDVSDNVAKTLRKFFLGMIYVTNVNASISPLRIAAKHYALHGLNIWKTIWEADMWPDKPVRDEGDSDESYDKRIEEWEDKAEGAEDIPIIIEACHPHNTRFKEVRGRVQYVTERHEQVCYDVKMRHPQWSNPKKKKNDQEVTYKTYWDDTYRCDLFDDEPVLKGGVVEHGYGFIPYVPVDSGLGNMASDGKPEKRYVGMLRHLKDMLLAESRTFSINDIITKKSGWPVLVAEGENAQEMQDFDMGYGAVNKLPSGVTVKELLSQGPPSAILQNFSVLADIISARAAPRSARGLSETGVRAAADRRLMIAEATLRYAYSKDAFRHGFSKVLINCAKIYKNVMPGEMRLWARTPSENVDEVIKKDDMRPPFTAFVEFGPLSEEDEYRRHEDLERMFVTGLTSKEWSWRQMSNVDPEEMEYQQVVDQLQQSPVLAQMDEQLLAAMYAQELAKLALKEGIITAPMTQPQQQQGQQSQGLVNPQGQPIGQQAQQQAQPAGNMNAASPLGTRQGQGGGGRAGRAF